MRKIPLTQGKFALVDDEDYDYLMQWKWHYAHGTARTTMNKKMLNMSRLIMDCPRGLITHHKDHDRLNHRKSNLVNTTYSCNNQHAYKDRTSQSSKYLGVMKTRNNSWRVSIRANGKRLHLGTFHDEKEVAKAYNKAALKYYGNTALLNKVPNVKAR